MAQAHPSRKARRWNQGHEEIVVAAVLLAVLLFLRLGIDSFVLGREGSFLGPKFWPSTLLTIGIVLSVVYLALAVVWARRQSRVDADRQQHSPTAPAGVAAPPATTAAAAHGTGATAADTTPGSDTAAHAGAVHIGEDASTHVGTDPVHTGSVAKMVGGFVLLAAYIYLLDPIGFVPATVLFSIAFMLLVGERRWWVLLIFPVVAVTVLLGIFTQLLVVSLPRGNGFLLTLSTYLY